MIGHAKASRSRLSRDRLAAGARPEAVRPQ